MKRKLSMAASVMLTVGVLLNTSPIYSSAAEKDEFVHANGIHFELEGKPFYFAGANSYDLFTLGDSSSASTDEDICTKYMYPDQIDARMKAMADSGVTVIRTWGFSNESWHGFETAPGKYVEPQFMLFDYIMKSAKEHGIKVIITLENYWEAYGGIDKKLSWAGESGGSHTSRAKYFSNEQCKQWYKDYVKHFAERTNYFTGEKYKDDPTIFAWDLMNEPRYQDAGENTTGNTLRAWIDEMGAYVKSVDPNHMVCAGLEGHGTEYNFGGDEGNPFVYIQQSPYIDFCSAHPYPDEYWANLTPEQNAETVSKWIDDAHNKVGKPFVVGEFNVKKGLPADKYEAYWRSVYDTVYEKDAAGALFWEFNDRQLSEFTVLKDNPILKYFKEMSNKMTAKNNGSITPVVDRKNKLSISDVSYDKVVDSNDITVNLTLASGNSLQDIKNGGLILTKGVDYTVNNNTVTIKSEYLKKLPVGKRTLTFDISDDNDPVLNLDISEGCVMLPDVPAAPTNINVTGKTTDSVSLSWTEQSADGAGIVTYKVFDQDNNLVGSTKDTSIVINNLKPDTEYEFSIVSVGDTGIKSEKSESVKVTTAKAEKPQDPAEVEVKAHEWKSNRVYNNGDQVVFNNNLYTAQWYTCGDKPGTTGEYGVWRLTQENVKSDAQESEDDMIWNASDVYVAGNIVKYNGNQYEAQWWTKGQEPGADQYGPWKELS